MKAKVNAKFYAYLDDIAAKVQEVCQDPYVRAALAYKLCVRFWPELSRAQAEIVVDTWAGNYDAATAAEEYDQQSVPA